MEKVFYKQNNKKNINLSQDYLEEKELMLEWKGYLLHGRCCDKLNKNETERLEWTKYMNDRAKEGRSLFHLTVTYKTFEGRDHTEQDANKNFINFYTKAFLPFLLDTRNYNRPRHRAVQPICLAFLDEHLPKPIEKTNIIGNYDCRFVDRLHHHTILAVHPDNVNTLLGQDINFLKEYKAASNVMTLHIVECEPQRLLYASKLMDKYPDYLIFSGLTCTKEKYKSDASFIGQQKQIDTPKLLH